MEVKVDQIDVEEVGYSFLVIYAQHRGSSSCDEIENIMLNDSFEIENEPSYSQIWNQVCEDIFGSWFVRTKYVRVGSWAIFCNLSKVKFLAKIQKNHFKITAGLASLEMERVQKLIYDKYGEQFELKMGNRSLFGREITIVYGEGNENSSYSR